MKKVIVSILCVLLALQAPVLAASLALETETTDGETCSLTFTDVTRDENGLSVSLRLQNLDVTALPVTGEMFSLVYGEAAFAPGPAVADITLQPLEERFLTLSYAVPAACFTGDYGVFLFTVALPNGDRPTLDVLDALGLAVEGAPPAVVSQGGVTAALGDLRLSLTGVAVSPVDGSDSLRDLRVTLKLRNNGQTPLDADNAPMVTLSFRDRYEFSPETADAPQADAGGECDWTLTFRVANAVAEATEDVSLNIAFAGETARFCFVPAEAVAAEPNAVSAGVAPFIEAGYRHSFAMASDGTLWAWGAGEYGRLGTGSAASAYEPGPVKLDNVVEVAAGWYHSIFRTADGSVYATGCNYDYGQVGDGSGINRSTPVKVLEDAVQVCAGADFSAALKSDGSVWVWGRNDKGQLGLSDTETRTTPQRLPLEDIVQIDAGEAFMAARTADGGLYLWGDNAYRQAAPIDDECVLSPRACELDAPAIDVALGNRHTMVLFSESSLTVWGDNFYGQLSDEDGVLDGFLKKNELAVTEIAAGGDMCALRAANGEWYFWGDLFGRTPVAPADPSLESLSLGYWHALGLEANGQAWGRGSNDYYQIGRVSGNTYLEWVRLSIDLTKITPPTKATHERDKAAASEPFAARALAVAAGYYTSFAIGGDGSVWAWGRSDYGQLGAGEDARKDTPVKLALKDVVEVAAGDYHTLFLTESGRLYGTGCNYDNNQLGNGSGENVDEPVQILENVRRAWAGRDISAALSNDGTLWTWGNNGKGQLGLGDTETHDGPAQVALEGVVDVAVGKQFMAALLTDGSVWMWGDNEYGQLGVKSAEPGTPVQVELPAIVSIAAGGAHMAALDTDGCVWTWGAGAYGQLGHGDGSDQPLPMRLDGLADVAEIYAGGDTTAARLLDGSMSVWGAYFYDAPYAEKIRFYVDAFSKYEYADIADIAMGSFHVLAVDVDGNVYALGDNSYGQLGVNDSSASSYYGYHEWAGVGLNLEKKEYTAPSSTPSPGNGHQALSA